MATQIEINDFKKKLPLIAKELSNILGESINVYSDNYWGELRTIDNYSILFRFDYGEIYAKYNHRGYKSVMRKNDFINIKSMAVCSEAVLKKARLQDAASRRAYCQYFTRTGCVD